jgi:hypothetical protein
MFYLYFTCGMDMVRPTTSWKIQNVTFAKKHGILTAPGFREISSRENQ